MRFGSVWPPFCCHLLSPLRFTMSILRMELYVSYPLFLANSICSPRSPMIYLVGVKFCSLSMDRVWSMQYGLAVWDVFFHELTYTDKFVPSPCTLPAPTWPTSANHAPHLTHRNFHSNQPFLISSCVLFLKKPMASASFWMLISLVRGLSAFLSFLSPMTCGAFQSYSVLLGSSTLNKCTPLVLCCT